MVRGLRTAVAMQRSSLQKGRNREFYPDQTSAGSGPYRSVANAAGSLRLMTESIDGYLSRLADLPEVTSIARVWESASVGRWDLAIML